jgi:hypothetical protein
MLPSKSYAEFRRLMMSDLCRDTRQYAGHVAGVDIYDRVMNRRDFECSS